MTIASLAQLADALDQQRLLTAEQREQLTALEKQFTDARSLARELVQRGWLTPYQVNQIFLGRAQELRLGPYVLLELGEGGMGQVFRARNLKLGRVVALKVVRKERLQSEDAVRRFQREIRAAGQLHHPHIVHALDADEIGGTHFFVMEYIDGSDLANLVKREGPLPVARACEYIRQAALGLQHAHERGLVHRDLKPHNLLLAPDGTVKILDMGLARLTHALDAGENSSTMTQEGMVMGTPDYLAPEQSLDAHTADIRADLYSLGCTLYFLLSGRVPFPGGSLTDKLLRHQLEEPEALENLRPDLPAEVAAIVRKLMAKRREQRLQTPRELADALANVLGSLSLGLPARPVPAIQAAATVQDVSTLGASEMAPQGALPGGTAILRASLKSWQKRLHHTDGKRWLLPAVASTALMLVGLAFFLWPRQGPAPEHRAPGAAKFEAKRPARRDPALPRVTDAWIKSVASLPAEQQVDEVVRKLRLLNPEFDGKVKPALEDGKVTGFEFLTDKVTDISALRALTGLKKLSCRGPERTLPGALSDLEPLRGLSLTWLDCGYNSIFDVGPLRGMPLQELHIYHCRVTDFGPLKGLPLKKLDCHGNPVKDLKSLKGLRLTWLSCGSADGDPTPLRGMPLQTLFFWYSPLKDISFVKDFPELTDLSVQATQVSDLSPITSSKVTRLSCALAPIASLAPLRESQITTLSMKGPRLPDLTPLRESRLENIHLDLNVWRGDREALAAVPTLKSINYKRAGDVLKQAAADQAAVEAWCKDVIKLPADKQVEAVKAELKKRNPGSPGTISSKIDKGTVIELAFQDNEITDITPLRALTGLKSLRCGGTQGGKCKLTDLWPLKGLRLETLMCNDSTVSDLAPVGEMPLKALACIRTQVTDLTALKGLPLTNLRLDATPVKDLTPLAGMKLEVLNVEQTAAADLSPLAGMPLESLNCGATKVSDVTPLKGLPLKTLACRDIPISDLSPLRGIPLVALHLYRTRISDFGPLADMPLQELGCELNRWRDGDLLRSIKSLKKINGKPAAEFWKVHDDFDNWCAKVAKLPATEQVQAVAAELKKRNPGFDGKIDAVTRDGAVLRLTFVSDEVTDLAPVRALPRLRELSCGGSQVQVGFGKLVDLWALKGLPLDFLDCSANQVADLSPLKGMPLTQLHCGYNRVADLSPLKGMGLRLLRIDMTKVTDLAPLRGMPLSQFLCPGAPIASLEPLAHMPLTKLDVHGCNISDLTPIKNLPLEKLFHIMDGAAPSVWRYADILRSVKTLRELNGKPAADFRKALDAFEDWSAQVGKLSADKQLEAVVAELKKRNPGFDGKLIPTIDNGVVTGLKIFTDEVADLAPLRALRGLKALDCRSSDKKRGQGRLADLWPLSGMGLEQLNCRDNRIVDLTPLKGMPLTALHIDFNRVSDLTPLGEMPLRSLIVAYNPVSDLTPLQGLKLESLDFESTHVKDLSPLRGLPLTQVSCGNGTPITDLSPLRGMKLTKLSLWRMPLSDLSVLQGMPLTWLNCVGAKVNDLAPLKGMPLTWLDCERSEVRDLAALKGLPLTTLNCSFTNVSDLTPLKGMPLTTLRCASTSVSDLTPLAGMKLLWLHFENTKITDFAVLKGMPLRQLTCDFQAGRDAAILRTITTLEAINQVPVREFWKEHEGPAP